MVDDAPAPMTKVGRLAESRLEQKEDYGRDTSNITSGAKGAPLVVGYNLSPPTPRVFCSRVTHGLTILALVFIGHPGLYIALPLQEADSARRGKSPSP